VRQRTSSPSRNDPAMVESFPSYGSTYSVYRVSPLYQGSSSLFDKGILDSHSRRFRDQLRGNSLRGVEIGLIAAHDGLSSAGRLVDCHWSLLQSEEPWPLLRRSNGSDKSHDASSGETRGICVHLQYEKTSYTGILLRDPDIAIEREGFTSLPLLLVRMPAPLRETFLSYLTTTFDSYISLLRFRSPFLTDALESFIGHFARGRTDRKGLSSSLGDILQSLQLQIAFLDSLALKNIDITIRGEDVIGFVTRGTQFNRTGGEVQSLLDGTEAWSRGPFMTALTEYLNHHLALTLPHRSVAITKIACGAFAISAEGKLKIFSPQSLVAAGKPSEEESRVIVAWENAIAELLTSIIKEGDGKKLLDDQTEVSEGIGFKNNSRKGAVASTSDNVPGSSKKKKATMQRDADRDHDDMVIGGRKHVGRHGVERLPTDPPPPYELYDPAIAVGGTAR
jgi:hypothetical protein